MNKKFIAKVLSVMLIIIVLASQIVAPASVSAESQKFASFTLVSKDDDNVINRDETVTFVFAVNKGFDKVNGFDFTVSFSTAYLTYEQNSLAFYAGTISNVSVNAIGNSIRLAWDSDTPVSLADGQKLFYLRFRVNSNVATGSKTAVTVKLNSMYSSSISGGKVTYTPFIFSDTDNPSAPIIIGEENRPADVVAGLINEIGAVTLDNECKARIDAASNAYYSLNVNSRAQVSNAQVLFDAIDEYQRLLDESTNIYAGVVAKFRASHDIALGLTKDSVALNDKGVVVAAYNALVELPLAAQAKLYSERTHLMSLLTRIAEIIAGNKGEEGDGPTKQEISEANAIVNDFIKGKGSRFEQFLLDGTENIDAKEAADMITAYRELFSNAGASAGSELEAIMLKKLAEAFGSDVAEKVDVLEEYLGRITDSNYIKLSRFKSEFAGILAKTPEELEYSDKTDVMIAATVLGWLDEGTIAYFKNPDDDFGGRSVYDIVMELLDAASLLEEEEQDDSPAETIIEEIIETITNTVTKTNTRTKTNTKLIYKTGAGEYLIKIATREIGAVVWVLLCLAALSSVIFVVLRIVYHNVSKIKREEQ